MKKTIKYTRIKNFTSFDEGLEKTAYNLAKKFQDDYNKATTSRPMQKYFLDQLDEYAKGQIKLTDLPKELQPGAKDLVNDIHLEWDLENTGYKNNRKKEYKSVVEQLDQLYHDMTAGKLDATGEWHKAIKAVKDKYAKE